MTVSTGLARREAKRVRNVAAALVGRVRAASSADRGRVAPEPVRTVVGREQGAPAGEDEVVRIPKAGRVQGDRPAGLDDRWCGPAVATERVIGRPAPPSVSSPSVGSAYGPSPSRSRSTARIARTRRYRACRTASTARPCSSSSPARHTASHHPRRAPARWWRGRGATLEVRGRDRAAPNRSTPRRAPRGRRSSCRSAAARPPVERDARVAGRHVDHGRLGCPCDGDAGDEARLRRRVSRPVEKPLRAQRDRGYRADKEQPGADRSEDDYETPHSSDSFAFGVEYPSRACRITRLPTWRTSCPCRASLSYCVDG